MHTDNQVTQWLTGKTSLSETSLDDWQNIVNEYPAFGLAQLFLTKKLKATKACDVESQKAALHFSDALWLNFLLTDFSHEEKNIVEENIPISTAENQQDLIQNNSEENIAPIAENRLASMLQAQAADFKKPVSKDEQLPTETEPLFKIDYFASQGILFPKSQDVLGNKVKKFTDWLKDIKKNTAGAPQLNTSEEEEKRAAAQANASLKTADVITEPMAEVLVQQGKNQHAVEVYQKLSLLYPEKSTYFAAKINLLQ